MCGVWTSLDVVLVLHNVTCAAALTMDFPFNDVEKEREKTRWNGNVFHIFGFGFGWFCSVGIHLHKWWYSVGVLAKIGFGKGFPAGGDTTAHRILARDTLFISIGWGSSVGIEFCLFSGAGALVLTQPRPVAPPEDNPSMVARP